MPPANNQRPPRFHFLAAVLITLLAAVPRLLFLGHDSLWFDEMMTRHGAVQGLAADVTALSGRDHLPLLYWLTAAVLRLLPEHAITLRLPSALAGVLTVPLLFAYGRALGRPRAGLWAAFLLALLPFHVRYAQEARHYALLLFFSLLASYWLYRAMSGRRGWPWVAFGAATAVNLLIHYSAWLLLVAHGLLGAVWLAAATRRERGAWRRAAPAVVIIGATVALLGARALVALRANTGGAMGTTAAAGLGVWLRELWWAFGMGAAGTAAILSLAVVVGLAILLRRRQWLTLAALLAPVVVPILLIQIFQISRFALPKYVIFMLPSWLLAAGMGLEAGVAAVARWRPAGDTRVWRASVAAALALGLGLLAVGPLRAEIDDMVHDWRGAAGQLGQGAPGDVVLALALDTGDGFNAAGIMAPVYLDPGFKLLDGNHLSAADVAGLAGQTGRVSALLLHLFQPVTLRGWEVSHHRGSLYAATATGEPDDLLAQLADLYGQLIPQATAPEPACSLRLKLARVELARGETERTAAALAAGECPVGGAEQGEIVTRIHEARLTAALAAGDRAAADAAAAALLALNPRHEAALAAISVVDWLAELAAGRLTVAAAASPEPVEMRRFTMPQDGDWGDVLFMHPAAAAALTVTLPPEPAALSFRVGLDPQSWEWGGDGVTFVVTAQAAGEPAQELYRRHVGRNEDGRGWHAAEVSLAEWAGRPVTITLSTEEGPAGDGTADWAGWDAPRVVRVLP